MSQRALLTTTSSFIYSIGQITLGLLLHPYQTMQSLVREKVFIWMTALPMVVLAVTTMLWRFGIVPVIRIIFSCTQTNLFACDWISFASNWVTFFSIYWQILLLYLLFRFTHAYRH
ncbi:MAG: hypothetical protein M3Q81_02210 [bacterium]|nr:hypothetical protein [bacterium]